LKPFSELKIVFRGSSQEANLVKGLLESEGIPAYLRDENIATMIPLQGMPTGFGSAKVEVALADEKKALEILKG